MHSGRVPATTATFFMEIASQVVTGRKTTWMRLESFPNSVANRAAHFTSMAIGHPICVLQFCRKCQHTFLLLGYRMLYLPLLMHPLNGTAHSILHGIG